MTRLSLRLWWNRMAGSSPSGRPRGRPGRPPTRLHLERLEGRCVPSTVTNLNDSGMGSLRQAILDTPAGGTVDFQPGLSGTIKLTSGELAVTKSLDIEGLGANLLTVDGTNASRVFDISGAGVAVTIAGLTVARGKAPAPMPGSPALGGGIYDDGAALTLSGCTLANNQALGAAVVGSGNGGPGQGGGGYVASGTVTIGASTFSGNRATGGNAGLFGGDGGPGLGGGVYVASGVVNLDQSTLIANQATGGYAGTPRIGNGDTGGPGLGGGVYV